MFVPFFFGLPLFLLGPTGIQSGLYGELVVGGGVTVRSIRGGAQWFCVSLPGDLVGDFSLCGSVEVVDCGGGRRWSAGDGDAALDVE